MAIKGTFKKVSYRQPEKKRFQISEEEKKKGNEYVLETSGSDIMKVLKMKGVDKRRTTTNHIWDIY